MGSKHYIGLAVLLVAAYFLGVYYPATGRTVASKVGL